MRDHATHTEADAGRYEATRGRGEHRADYDAAIEGSIRPAPIPDHIRTAVAELFESTKKPCPDCGERFWGDAHLAAHRREGCGA